MFLSPVHRILLSFALLLSFPALAKNRLELSQTGSAEPVALQASIQLAPQPTHVHRPYVDGKGDVYWPQDQPVWIWLGTSAESNDGSVLLQGMPGSSAEESERYRSQGIGLEITGNQYIRWLHYFTKEETLYRFFADGIHPVSQIEISGSNRYERGRQVFFSGSIETRLSAEDEGSSVEAIYQSVNGNVFQKANNLILNREGRYHVRHYAVDRVGWTSEPQEVDLVLDLTPPQSVSKLPNSPLQGFAGPDSSLRIESQDALSGVRRIWYQWDQQERQEVGQDGVVEMKNLSRGVHRLRFQAEDNVGNLEPMQEAEYFFDNEGPEVSHTIEGDFYEEGRRSYVSPRSKVRINAQDSYVEVAQVEYRINGVSYGNYSAPFLIPVTEGTFRLEYQGTDVLNNRSSLSRAEFVMDSQAPETELLTQGASYRRGINALWVRSDTALTLKARDELAGVRDIGFGFSESELQPYETPIYIEKEGRYLFQYRAVDQVGNEEVPTPVLLVVDNTAPTIMESYSIAPTKSYQVSGEVVQAYPPYTVLFLAASDNSANLKEVRYRNGDQMVPYQQALVLQKPGAYELEVEAEDNVGNIAQKTLRFIIEAGDS
ncbi:MAG: OmpL47-type beta-barrel domain-containing protein [bacterium]